MSFCKILERSGKICESLYYALSNAEGYNGVKVKVTLTPFERDELRESEVTMA